MRQEVKVLWTYIAPSIVGALIAGSFSIVDTIFIGHGMGKIGLAAVALTWPPVMLVNAAGSLLGAGAAVLISQARGAGDESRARRVFGNLLTLQILVSLVLGAGMFIFCRPILELLGATPELLPTAMEYARVILLGSFICMFMTGCLEVVRNDGRPVLSMWLLVVGLLGNIFLDWLFIFVFDWGAEGAAAATVASQGFSGLCGLIYFLSPKTQLKWTLRTLVPAKETVRDISVTGLPIFGNMLSIIAMLFMHNFQSLRIGGVDGLAAYTLVAAVESVGSMMMTGLAGGIQPLVAKMYGGKKWRLQNRFGNYGYATAFATGVVMMLFSFAMRDVMPSWVGLSGEVAELAAHGILLSSPAFILLGVVRVAGFYYQSTGKITASSLLIYGDAFFALPLCLFVLPIWLGMDGFWLAMPVSRVILFAMLCWLWFGKNRERGEERVGNV